jgi:UPF0716 protein FxsA
MGWLLLLFIALPAAELALLIEIGRRIGTLETLALIVVTGVVGASMARSQGLRVVAQIREQTTAGEMPAESLLDGLIILIASALLVTPGVLTDVFGFLCLVPAFRGVVKRNLVRRLERAVKENRVRVVVHGHTQMGGTVWTTPLDPDREGPRREIDVTPKRPDE